MDAEEVFKGILDDYWLKVAQPRVHALTVDTPIKELQEMKDIAKDCDMDGVDFIWKDMTIDGNKDKCVVGTILADTKGSMIYPLLKKYKFILSVLIQEKEKQPLHYSRVGCKKHCIGCLNRDVKKCVSELKSLEGQLYDKGGLRDQVLAKVAEDDWKTTSVISNE